MSDLLLMLVFLPMAAGPFGFWMGLRYPKARDTFVLAVAVLETMMVVSLWTSPVLESGIDGFCGLGIRFVSGDFHTLMATPSPPQAGWRPPSSAGSTWPTWPGRTRYYLFWLMTLGATMGVFLSAISLPPLSSLRSCPLLPLWRSFRLRSRKPSGRETPTWRWR